MALHTHIRNPRNIEIYKSQIWVKNNDILQYKLQYQKNRKFKKI